MIEFRFLYYCILILLYFCLRLHIIHLWKYNHYLEQITVNGNLKHAIHGFCQILRN